MRKHLAVLAALILAAALAACAEVAPTQPPPVAGQGSSVEGDAQTGIAVEDQAQDQAPVGSETPPDPAPAATYGSIGEVTPSHLSEIAERFGVNDHTVGWLGVPGTNINDVVVRNPDDRDNLYYLRRNFYREPYFYGVLYIDFRADLGPTREHLGVNTTIYGHTVSDDPESGDFDIMLGNLHRFRDPEFMRENPYIFFSLPGEDLAFEIVAVFFGNVMNPAFSYNNNHPDPGDFIHVLENEVLPRSLYVFDHSFELTDRFLTLTTDVLTPPEGAVLDSPFSMYRFGVTARLLDPSAPRAEYATFTLNENRTIDPDGMWSN